MTCEKLDPYTFVCADHPGVRRVQNIRRVSERGEAAEGG